MTSVAKQIGNAVPPPLARALATTINEILLAHEASSAPLAFAV